MSGRLLLVARLLLLTLFVAPALAVPIHQQGEWLVVAPADEGFSIHVPVKPDEHTDRNTFQGDTYKMRLYTCNDEASGMLYMVVMQEFPNLSILTPTVRLDKFMDGFKEGFVKSLAESAGMKVELRPDHDLTFKGASVARQYTVSLGQTTGLLRAFDVNPRTYLLMVLGGDEKKAEVTRFFDSFEIKAAPAPVAQPMTTAKPL